MHGSSIETVLDVDRLELLRLHQEVEDLTLRSSGSHMQGSCACRGLSVERQLMLGLRREIAAKLDDDHHFLDEAALDEVEER